LALLLGVLTVADLFGVALGVAVALALDFGVPEEEVAVPPK